ncbi:mannan endo-1,6-alpha-mannosidase DCW1-like protein [Xylaria palmicola]|nr:mannan endo-1,6-alpha-mannosidase DCW1-like protein [Xylaria palmicola]
MDPRYAGSEGNDDQSFWAFSILEAAERNFPQPDDSIPPWLKVAENIWNSLVARWDDTTCGGGLHWQIFAGNPNGLDYKNAVSNGGFFQVSARLARATGNETYLRWAERVWDWSRNVGFIDEDFNVQDGASSAKDCRDTNPLRFSYSQGIYMYGAAVLFNYTDGDPTWAGRVNGLLQAAQQYFGPFPNATNVMFEPACEEYGTCNTDMKSFKGYLSRFMSATTQMMPSTRHHVRELLGTSAMAVGKACSGGGNGTVCGEKWYVGGYDENPGLGQQMTALETVQALLGFDAQPPLRFGEIRHVKGKGGVTGGEPSSVPPQSPVTTPSITPTPSTTTSATTTALPSTTQQPDSSAQAAMASLRQGLLVFLTLVLIFRL